MSKIYKKIIISLQCLSLGMMPLYFYVYYCNFNLFDNDNHITEQSLQQERVLGPEMASALSSHFVIDVGSTLAVVAEENSPIFNTHQATPGWRVQIYDNQS